ncbi:hypothetical protein [Kordiimonas laminariae]|uniref:hypothetical protein n=1 Tax=Kordiimonas laminariae TaxID=2917717 RepID=UPI001FF5B973|nr:hypothetical protein [Kordiimonas laminariae]MCK0068766.1 hypothetical protein [Kordiimonas laminariae]
MTEKYTFEQNVIVELFSSFGIMVLALAALIGASIMLDFGVLLYVLIPVSVIAFLMCLVFPMYHAVNLTGSLPGVDKHSKKDELIKRHKIRHPKLHLVVFANMAALAVGGYFLVQGYSIYYVSTMFVPLVAAYWLANSTVALDVPHELIEIIQKAEAAGD